MKNKKAISLIVLIITIIVMIILASAIIISLDNANIFNKAEEAVEKTNTATNKYLSEIKLAERELEKIQGPSQVNDANPGELREEGNICYIESIEDLVEFSEMVNSGEETFEGKTVKLTRLLDFNSDNSYVEANAIVSEDLNGDGIKEAIKTELTTERGFTPIGTPDNPFKGTFDGDGAEIRNMYINIPDDVGEDIYTGLFGYIIDSDVKNLGITGNIYYNYGYGAAGLVSATNAVSKNCNILNCYSKVNLYAPNGTQQLGGILAGSETSDPNFITIIEDCYNDGNLITTYANVGGIVAEATDVEINKCYNIGNMTIEENTQVSIVGGIVGKLNSNSYVKNSYNLGKITGKSLFTYFGGIVGEFTSVGSVYNSYNAGMINNIDVSSDARTGGIVANSKNIRELDINNCYNFGEIKAANNKAQELIGDIGSATIGSGTENIYYDEEKTAYLGTPSSTSTITLNPTPLALSYIKSQEFVDLLNGNASTHEDWVNWKLGPQGYPILDM